MNTLTVLMYEPFPPNYLVSLVLNCWLYAEPISFRDLILPKQFPHTTPLLNLQPLPLAALHKEFEALYSRKLQLFNKIQTQV
jgi:pre-mRNA-splicing helicase BRR2